MVGGYKLDKKRRITESYLLALTGQGYEKPQPGLRYTC
jgi:hypothetical protein